MPIEKFDPDRIDWVCSFTVYGEAASKANARQLVLIKNKIRPIKSKKALAFVQAMDSQCPQLDPIIEDDLIIACEIFYASRRPDLDESLVLDVMQGKIYKNDRQVKQKHIFWGLDKNNPRIEIRAAYLN